MTIKELTDELKKYPEEMMILGTDSLHSVDPKTFETFYILYNRPILPFNILKSNYDSERSKT